MLLQKQKKTVGPFTRELWEEGVTREITRESLGITGKLLGITRDY